MTLQRKSFAEACAFSRAGEATFFGSNGLMQTTAAGVPRFDYDPVTLEPKGILIEGARTNLLLQSNDFTAAAWLKTDCSVASAQDGAAGPTSATAIVENSSTGYHRIEQAASYTAGQIYQLQVIAKKGANDVLSLTINGASTFTPNPPRVYFNLSTGTVGAQQNLATGRIVNLGGGRYLCSIGVTAGASGSGVVQIGTHQVDGVLIHPGVGATGAYVEAIQLEAGAFPSYYIPTTTMVVTRAADILTVQPAQFAAAFRQDAGTILIDMTLNHTGLTATGSNDFPFLLDMDSAAAPGDGYSVLASGGYGPGFRLNVTTGSADQATFTIAKALGGGSRTKLALSWGGANDFAACMDGGAVQTDTSGTLPTPDRLSIGCQNGSNNQMFGHVRKVLFFPQRLTNAQLQEATA